ncbi:hypothetical protein [Corynebacterium mucifaciens]|uniref:Uncharacterized protein n=1 Tax=Corynebacterium mucifaciens TaxID=57171 RepID=A0A7X6LQR7_9CORY|nr:hypothetical protein [Corynebacterium mucifaciens]NKY68541.1 hypothetical protein [Corynebacterium mucifaciens]
MTCRRAAPLSAGKAWLSHCALVPGSQRVRLSRVNLSGGNDAQIAATYSAEDVAKLRAAE